MPIFIDEKNGMIFNIKPDTRTKDEIKNSYQFKVYEKMFREQLKNDTNQKNTRSNKTK